MAHDGGDQSGGSHQRRRKDKVAAGWLHSQLDDEYRHAYRHGDKGQVRYEVSPVHATLLILKARTCTRHPTPS